MLSVASIFPRSITYFAPPDWFYRVRLQKIVLAARRIQLFSMISLRGALIATGGGRNPMMGSRPCQVNPKIVARARSPLCRISGGGNQSMCQGGVPGFGPTVE